MKVFDVYTDGSYLRGDSLTHGGIVFVNTDTNTVSSTIHVQTSIPDFVSMWNIGGELLAAWSAIMAVTSSVKKSNDEVGLDTYKMYLTYDLEGVGKYITGAYKAKKKATRWFHDSVHQLLQEVPNLELKLRWVKGHNGTTFNEIADAVSSYNPDSRYKGCSVCDMDDVLRDTYGF